MNYIPAIKLFILLFSYTFLKENKSIFHDLINNYIFHDMGEKLGRDPQFDTTDTPTIIRNSMFEVRIFVTVNHIFFGINELICIFVQLVYSTNIIKIIKEPLV